MTANNTPARPHLGYKRAHADYPQPESWTDYQPDSSLCTYTDEDVEGLCRECVMPSHTSPCVMCRPTSAHQINCRALTEPLMVTDPIMDGPALTWRWDGYRNESECIEITRYMERIGCVWTHVPGAKTCHYYHATLWLNVTMHDTGKVFVVLRDYNQMDPQPVSRMLVIDGGAR